MKNYTFSHLLKVTRMRNGFDQAEFSQRLDVSQSTYSRYEKGRIDPPIGFLNKLVKDYNFPAYLLLYSDLENSLSELPLNALEFLVFENSFDYNPVRLKSKKRREEGLIEITTYWGSLVVHLIQKYGELTISDFTQVIEDDIYNRFKMNEALSHILKALNVSEGKTKNDK